MQNIPYTYFIHGVKGIVQKYESSHVRHSCVKLSPKCLGLKKNTCIVTGLLPEKSGRVTNVNIKIAA